MTNGGKEKLLALLSGESRKLVNVKFMPGTDRGLTADQIAGTAADALEAAFSKGLIHEPPMSGLPKITLE